MRGEVEKVGVIRDPAVAVAAAKCWLHRWSKRVDHYTRSTILPQLDTLHRDEPCGFCEYRADALIVALEEFIEWSGLRRDLDDGGTAFRSEIESFLMLTSEQQKEAVVDAQYGE